MSGPDDLNERARDVIDTNRYLTLGTTEPDGRPRVSPVFFTHADYRDYYWLSSPEATHSRNIEASPAVAMVVYDSTAEVGKGRAVYITATARAVPADELPPHHEKAMARIEAKGARRFTRAELTAPEDLRLYHARATAHDIHVPAGDPVHGTGIDTRREVTP